MNAFKTILFVAMVTACVVAEPPRRRFGFRKFARQEIDDSGSTPEEQPPQDSEKPGYEYSPPPESQRLRLPSRIRLTAFARQEEAPSNGYNYPKPDSTYGPPTTTTEEAEPTDVPATEYGVPDDTATTTAQPEESSDVPETTTNPQAEQLKNIRASQLRRQNAKLLSSQKFVRAKQQQVKQQQPQPIFYFQYPVTTDFEPQYVYIFK